ncbi:hypothetical protein BDV26DRAFT_121477 [Aspergillus bertholletiae]|uniref:Uncharacterized protein n=1 Tax=Aspergillus bertholletiae TaxID=1226010 RepID=A0A5N7ASE7_9EURO|nr:hypothetical protein BDV26DRAFT_121477 [Aspergillus bertholletiae]
MAAISQQPPRRIFKGCKDDVEYGPGDSHVSLLPTMILSAEVDPKLATAIQELLNDLATGKTENHLQGASIEVASSSLRTLQVGLHALLGNVSIPGSQAWEDAVAYCRAVIDDPQDTLLRANSYWTRSCSDINKELLTRFGPGIIAAARKGVVAIVSDYFRGQRLNVPHVDKKASFVRNWQHLALAAEFYPASDPLVVGCYESGTLPCGLGMTAWLGPEAAVKAGSISRIAVCDDYGSFSNASYNARLRMVAFPLGVAYEVGGRAVNVIVDGSMLQSAGTGEQLTPEAAMAWRVVGGCTSPYSAYTFGTDSLEEGLVMPEVYMAIHDLLDWRCDIAAGNHENSVCAIYGLGFKDPFHVFLEKALQRADFHPLSGGYAIGAMVSMHFTASRYGAYHYCGKSAPPCPECIRLLQSISTKAGLTWAPKQPPRSFGGGHGFRVLGKLFIDRFEDHGLVQEGLSWFQCLISSGDIWLFDALRTVDDMDTAAEWS